MNGHFFSYSMITENCLYKFEFKFMINYQTIFCTTENGGRNGLKRKQLNMHIATLKIGFQLNQSSYWNNVYEIKLWIDYFSNYVYKNISKFDLLEKSIFSKNGTLCSTS